MRAAKGRFDASALLELQRSAGNEAVGMLLQRASATADAGAKADAGTGAAYMEGKAADDLLDAFLKTLPGARGAVRNPAEGHVKVEDAATFKAALDAYAKGRSMNDKSFDPDAEAARGLSVGAFEDENHTIHIREGRGEFTTTLHEAFHLRESEAFKNNVQFNGSEGITEVWTRTLCKAAPGLSRGEYYTQQREAAEALIEAAGVEAVAAAYFTGNLGIVKLLHDREPGASKGAKVSSPFYVWRNAMSVGDYGAAKNAFKNQEKSKP